MCNEEMQSTQPSSGGVNQEDAGAVCTLGSHEWGELGVVEVQHDLHWEKG